MKQLFSFLAIAFLLVACGNDSNSKNETGNETPEMTTPSMVDSNTVVSPADSTANAPLVDTIKR